MSNKKNILLALVLAVIIIVIPLLNNEGHSLSLKDGLVRCSKLHIEDVVVQVKYSDIFKSSAYDRSINLYHKDSLEKSGGGDFILVIMESQGDKPESSLDEIMENSVSTLPQEWKNIKTNFNSYPALLSIIRTEPYGDINIYKIPYNNHVIWINISSDKLSPEEKLALQKVSDGITFSKSKETAKETYVSKCGLIVK